ncbi:MAG: hypothetical protein JNL40_17160 [Cyclobacteriaceae bacterium]|nr:hypothetical protein [Cyclobacteriaceae bacterium]
MNTLRALLVTMITLALGCSKTSDTVSPTLLGTWKQTSTTIENCTDTSLNQAETNCTTCALITLSVTNNVNVYSGTNSSGSATSGTWLPGGPYTNPTGYISFTETGGSTSAASYTMTMTTLILTVEGGFPGAGCKVIQKFTRQ